VKKRFLQPRAAPAKAGAIDSVRYEDRRYEDQRLRGFGWLRFSPDLEEEYRTRLGAHHNAAIQNAFGLALLALSSVLIFGELPRLQWSAVALAILLSCAGLYLAARESRRNFLLHREMQQLARVDGLTGALNRRAFHDHLELIWRQAERENVAVGLMLLDLDHFKTLNDRHGHQAGDIVLRTTADILRSYALRPLDAVGRYGGDEYIVTWYDAEPGAFSALIQLLPAKLWMGLAGVGVREADMTVSGGAVLVRPSEGASIEVAIRNADEELYKVKRSCRGVIAMAATLLEKGQGELFSAGRADSTSK